MGTITKNVTHTHTPDASNPNDVYNVEVKGVTGEGTVIVAVGAGVAHFVDTATNTSYPNEASTSDTGNTVTVDTTKPTTTVNQKDGQLDPTNGTSIQFTVVFSEPVKGLMDQEVNVAGTAQLNNRTSPSTRRRTSGRRRTP